MDRRERLLHGLDLAALSGLEIGPRHAPLVSKGQGRVLYVDYACTEQLRADWDKPHIIDPATFMEVDLVWGDTPLPLSDYVVASHVIEHVPDLVGWLNEIRQALRPDGLLCLAIPDRRFTFDLLRKESGLAEVVEAHLLGAKQPSIRQVFDSYAFTRPNGVDAWTYDAKAQLKPMPEKLGKTYAVVQALKAAPRYVDSHCWVFTPRSFLDLLEGMAALELLSLEIADFHPTLRGEGEFIVRMRGQDRPELIAASITRARAELAKAATPPGDEGAFVRSPEARLA